MAILEGLGFHRTEQGDNASRGERPTAHKRTAQAPLPTEAVPPVDATPPHIIRPATSPRRTPQAPLPTEAVPPPSTTDSTPVLTPPQAGTAHGKRPETDAEISSRIETLEKALREHPDRLTPLELEKLRLQVIESRRQARAFITENPPPYPGNTVVIPPLVNAQLRAMGLESNRNKLETAFTFAGHKDPETGVLYLDLAVPANAGSTLTQVDTGVGQLGVINSIYSAAKLGDSPIGEVRIEGDKVVIIDTERLQQNTITIHTHPKNFQQRFHGQPSGIPGDGLMRNNSDFGTAERYVLDPAGPGGQQWGVITLNSKGEIECCFIRSYINVDPNRGDTPEHDPLFVVAPCRRRGGYQEVEIDMNQETAKFGKSVF